jgi:dienelactone hydrolase
MKRLLPLLLLLVVPFVRAEEPLAGTRLLDSQLSPEDRSAAMVAGIGKWLHAEAARETADRHQRWEAAAKGKEWEKFAAEKRVELAKLLGFEKRAAPALERLQQNRVRWSVFEDFNGEGILLQPPGQPLATVIVVAEAGELPELSTLARSFVQAGCQVLVPELVNRRDDFSANPAVRMTNQPHREWIYRQAFEMGRTLIGYEVQSVLAALDALQKPQPTVNHDELPPLCAPGTPVYIAGRGEGALIALRAAALDSRFRGVRVSASFEPHTAYELEPIYRNLFGTWKDFGDAELAALVAPSAVVIDLGEPWQTSPPRPGATPGVLPWPSQDESAAEIAAANHYRSPKERVTIGTGFPELPMPPAPSSGSVPGAVDAALFDQAPPPEFARERQRRLVRGLEQHTQQLIFDAERARNAEVWATIGTPAWEAARPALQERLWASIGKLPADRLPPNPRARRIVDAPKWTAYEVMLDVAPEVFAWGYLLVPKDLQPGERRPVVVCQHGLEGLPGDTVTEDPKDPGFRFYQGFAARLADLGYITYAPHNPYRGKDAFRTLQRQANPLGLSLFSFIIAQHEVATAWLAGLPFVDPKRIGFYGLSYGGKTAMRVPALVDRYALSICSGDFNEWIRKNASVEERPSYMWTGEYEIFEWNLAWNANYAEMAMLIAPRPFMVERGHKDGVATDEWVGYEFAKVKRGYLRLGVPERATIEWFDGPHMINGKGTFEFLREHLGPPKR